MLQKETRTGIQAHQKGGPPRPGPAHPPSRAKGEKPRRAGAPAKHAGFTAWLRNGFFSPYSGRGCLLYLRRKLGQGRADLLQATGLRSGR